MIPHKLISKWADLFGVDRWENKDQQERVGSLWRVFGLLSLFVVFLVLILQLVFFIASRPGGIF